MVGYLTHTLGARGSASSMTAPITGWGWPRRSLADSARPSSPGCMVEVKRGDKNFSAAVTQIKNAQPDAIFYGGYYTEAAILVHQLRDAGVDATFASGDASNDPEFVKQAGAAAKDALLSCPCAPASGVFADQYRKTFGQQAGTYSDESYDLATIMIKGVDAGQVTRPALLDYLHRYRGQGFARSYQWNPDGELTDTLIWMYKVQ
ncbi:ABC-type branched-subunit amino acid transport system substrate-binding protein [Mycobacterium sp. URHB0021]